MSVDKNAKMPWLFLIVLVCSIFQFFVLPPIGGIYIPLYLIAAYALALKVNWMTAGQTTIGRLLLGLYTIQIISWVWSPDVVFGFRDLVYTFPFLIIFLYVHKEIQRNPDGIWKAIRIYCVLALVQSALVILFRLNPNVEASFWSTSLAKITINPNGLSEFLAPLSGNNTYDEVKAGGFMLNANIAGAWAGLCLWLSAAAKQPKSKLWAAAMAIHALAMLACGSKASLALLFIVPVMVRLFVVSKRKVACIFATIFVIVCLAAVSLPIIEQINSIREPEYVEASTRTFMSRYILWKHAANEFLNHPILGQGYGGWELSTRGIAAQEGYQGFAVSDSFPPHNLFIILWSRSGLLSLLLGSWIILHVFRILLDHSTSNVRASSCLFGAYLIYFVQASGENSGFFGDSHQISIIAFILGVASYLHTQKNIQERPQQ